MRARADAVEANFDGLVGPTHNYAGLSLGNVASERNEGTTSSPRRAALEGLEKMRFVAGLGIPQGVLPPHERPHVAQLRALGFEGTDEAVLHLAARESAILLAQVYSSSNMWAANAATVGPSSDSDDAKVHFTPANLATTFHRSLEPPQTARALARIFEGDPFVHHEPLPRSAHFADEGAANHTRLEGDDGRGTHFFVYGRSVFTPSGKTPSRYPARQTLEASRAIARLHRLDETRTVFAQQNADAIDEGVFHNDVVAVGHRNVLLYHEQAFTDGDAPVEALRRTLAGSLLAVRVSASELPLGEAIRSYLFNSQLVTTATGHMAIVAPREVEESEASKRVVDRILANGGPIREVHYLDVRESMRNGGGPACLRLRVFLTRDELARVHRRCLLDDALCEALAAIIERRYRDVLAPPDLLDPQLVVESRTALDEISAALGFGGDFYPFQRG